VPTFADKGVSSNQHDGSLKRRSLATYKYTYTGIFYLWGSEALSPLKGHRLRESEHKTIRTKRQRSSSKLKSFITSALRQIRLLGRLNQGELHGRDTRHMRRRWKCISLAKPERKASPVGPRCECNDGCVKVSMWITWIRISTSGGILWTRQWTFGFLKRSTNCLFNWSTASVQRSIWAVRTLTHMKLVHLMMANVAETCSVSLVIPFHLQSVPVHSANCVKTCIQWHVEECSVALLCT
jgi:hypothetical protein